MGGGERRDPKKTRLREAQFNRKLDEFEKDE